MAGQVPVAAPRSRPFAIHNSTFIIHNFPPLPLSLFSTPNPSCLLSSLLRADGRSTLFKSGRRMELENLTQLVSQLSPEEQSAIRECIAFLKERHGKQPETAFWRQSTNSSPLIPNCFAGSPSDGLSASRLSTRGALCFGTQPIASACGSSIFGLPFIIHNS